MVTDEMVEKAVSAALRADIIPADDPKYEGVRINEYLSYTPAEAVELGVHLTQTTEDGKPRWHGFTDIMGDEYDDTNRAILRPVIRAALEAALSAAEPVESAELIATAKQWYDWSREWSGSAFLNDEPTGEMTEVECKAELYRGLCSLGNHMMWLEDQLRVLVAPALSAQVQDVAGWQLIETAPKDVPVLGYWSYVYPGDVRETNGIDIIEWYSGKFTGWKSEDGVASDGVYTHWMPLPEAPSPAAPAMQEGGTNE